MGPSREPLPPTDISATRARCNSALVQWRQGAQHSAPVASYEVQLRPMSQFAQLCAGSCGPGSQWSTAFNGAAEWCELRGLQPGCNYAVRIRSWTDDDTTSAWSKEFQVQLCPCFKSGAATCCCCTLLAASTGIDGIILNH